MKENAGFKNVLQAIFLNQKDLTFLDRIKIATQEKKKFDKKTNNF